MSHFYGNHGTSAYDMKKYMRVRMRNDSMKPPHSFSEDITITNNNGNISIKAQQMKDGIAKIIQANNIQMKENFNEETDIMTLEEPYEYYEPMTLEEPYQYYEAMTPGKQPIAANAKPTPDYIPINTESQDKKWSLEHNIITNELYLIPSNKKASNYVLQSIKDEFREDLFPLVIPTIKSMNGRSGLNVGYELLIDIKSKTIHWRKDPNMILAYNPVQGIFSKVWTKITGNMFIPTLELVPEATAVKYKYMYKWGV